MLIFKRSDTGTEMKCPETWDEITVGKYAKFQKIYDDTIKEIKKEFDVDDELELDMGKVLIDCPQYFKRIVAFWLGINEVDCDRADYNDIIMVWSLITDILQPPKDIKPLSSFDHEGKTYKIIPSKTDTLGMPVEFEGYTFGDVLQFLQIETNQKEVSNGKLKAIPYQIALLYREEGEEYDSERVKDKGKEFESLTMDKVWGISFFLMRQKINSLRDTLSSLPKEIKMDQPIG